MTVANWIELTLLGAGSILAFLFHLAESWRRVTTLADLSRPIPRHAKWTMDGETRRLRPPADGDDHSDWPGRVLD